VKRLAATITILAFCATAFAAQNPGAGLAGGPDSATGQGYSHAKYDEVLGRLKLTDEQIKKINAIYEEYNKKLSDIRAGMMVEKKLASGRVVKSFDRNNYEKYMAKQKELFAERDAKILEVLTEDQQKKFKEAKAIIAEFDIQNKTLNDELKTARQHMGNDRKKMSEFYKGMAEKRRKVYTERRKSLDEKIGKLPAMANNRQGGANFAPGTR
jgi:Spy/CpxP family protein refolding chaperone